MTEAYFPGLFRHSARLEWGVSVLAGERDGKRRYLFEGGDERTMAAAHEHFMQRVEAPDHAQQATYARLMALLAKRDGGEPAAPRGPQATLEQVEKFRAKYEGGFSGEAWQTDERNVRVRKAREVAEQAAQALSAKALEELIKARRTESIWGQVVSWVGKSELISDELKTTTNGAHQAQLGEAVQDLLHGSGPYERRFDGFVRRYEALLGSVPSWPVATALSALVAPKAHVCVDPMTFRKQLKLWSRTSTLAARPTGANYVRCQNMARALATSLATHGEVPKDLLEVGAFIRAIP